METRILVCVCVCCVCASVFLCFLGVWAFLWFVCFCLLANQWSYTQDTRGIPTDAAGATVAFSFFSIATWVSVLLSLTGTFSQTEVHRSASLHSHIRTIKGLILGHSV